MTNTNQIWKISCRGIIIDQDQIFTIRMKPTDDFYCLPGGKLDAMESLEDCMVREIKEELGIKGEVGPLLFVHQGLLERYQKHVIEFFYLITNGSDFRQVDLSNSSHGFEITEIKRVDLDDSQLNFQPDFVFDYLKGKTIEDMMTMGTQSVVSH